MLCENVGYDSVKDISAVDPYGFIDLAEAFDKGSVPSAIADEAQNYNQIEDPGTIIGTPKDIFEGYRMRDALLNVDKSLKTSPGSVISEKADE